MKRYTFILWTALAASTTSSLATPAPQDLPPSTRAAIETLLQRPEIQNAHIGMAIVALGEAKNASQFPATPYDGGGQPLLYGLDAEKKFLPASNMKLFTATWVLKQLGPDAVFTTRVMAATAEPSGGGKIPQKAPVLSVLTLTGDSDPSLTTADLRDLAKQVVKAEPGRTFVVRAQNSVNGDERNGENNGNRYPKGWTLEDTLWYYGSPVTGLAVNRNQIEVKIVGTTPGKAAKLECVDDLPFPILNLVTTVAKDDPRAGEMANDRGDAGVALGTALRIEGFVAPGETDDSSFAVPNPTEWARQLFVQALKAKGAKVVEPDAAITTLQAVSISQHASAPLTTLFHRFLKSSDNLYGEMLLRRAGATVSADQTMPKDAGIWIESKGMARRAHKAMTTWLSQSGIPLKGDIFVDGSGLSFHDLVTPISIVRLLGLAQTLPGGDRFYNDLPIAGVDGGLFGRMLKTAAVNNVHAKTGNLDIASCLSGYVTTRDGQRLAVSILTNEMDSNAASRKWQDDLMVVLANTSWK